MKILKQILIEIKEIKKALQTISSSLECGESNQLPVVMYTADGLEVKFPNNEEI